VEQAVYVLLRALVWPVCAIGYLRCDVFAGCGAINIGGCLSFLRLENRCSWSGYDTDYDGYVTANDTTVVTLSNSK
jgi:hypothetical protein